MDFYTYIYYDPSRNNEAIYVGKGKDGRAWFHLTRTDKNPFVNRLKHMRRNNVSPIIGIYSGLDEEFAFFLEEEIISHIGRKNVGNGPLLNLTNGGEGNAGRIVSDETKKKIGDTQRGRVGNNKGSKFSDEARKNIAAGRRGKTSPNKGRKFSDEHRARLSAALKGKPAWNKGIRKDGV